MKKKSDIETVLRSLTAALLMPLVALASAAPGFAAAAPPTSSATASTPAAAPATQFSKDQLEQMVAPIALYPDGLMTQILMAATFPVEIVQAARWQEKNASVTGTALDEALKKEDWDASVKSMCGFPDVLKRLNENLDWTQDLGQAFLGQRVEVLDAVQRMRGKAYESGNLKTTEQQTVTQQPDKIIVIQPSNPEVVYVPQYSSTVVYGAAWAYPTYYYPPYYYAPYGYGAMAFATGMFVGAAIWGGCNWGWGGSDVNIDIDRQNNFNRNTDRNHVEHNSGDRGNRGDRGQNASNKAGNKAGSKQSWNRTPSASEKRAQGKQGSAGVSNNAARGYGSSSGGRGQGGSASPSTGNRGGAGGGPSASTREAGGSFKGGGSSSGGASAGASSRSGGSSSYGGGGRSSGGSGSSAWSGSRGGSSSTRSASSRGSMSRGGGGGRGGRR